MTRHIPIHIGQPDRVALTMVGCGGTGSFLALHLARLAYHVYHRPVPSLGTPGPAQLSGAGGRDGLTAAGHLEYQLIFVDPDRIEAKNVGRQNFVPAEIGRYKAEALAVRYSRAFGLSIHFYNEAFDPIRLVPGRNQRGVPEGFDLIVGCVDNTAARREIDKVCRRSDGHLWWLDCGNHDQSGQVILGNQNRKTPQINPFGFCTGLPLPSIQHPELIRRRNQRRRTCTDDLLADVQSLMVNQAVAGWAASYVYRLTVAHDLDCYATYFDLLAGVARSEYIATAPHQT
jgi:PRTRC genetic system ThiF family protein